MPVRSSIRNSVATIILCNHTIVMIAIQSAVQVPDPLSVPSNAPEHCPVRFACSQISRKLTLPNVQGTESELAGKADACAGCANQEICASNIPKGPDPALPFIRERMSSVKRKILVLSGKGGVGKSTFTAQLGWAFAADEDLQVCSLNASKIVISIVRSDRDHGRRHLRSINTHHPRHRIRAGP